MNKLIITIVSSLLLTTTGIVMAGNTDDGSGGKRKHHQREMQAMPLVDKMVRAVRHLDLDEEQKAAVKAVVRNLKRDIHPIMAETKAGHRELKELIKAPAFNAEAVALLAQKEGELAAERLMLTSQALSTIYMLLTDEQRAELETKAAQRKKQHGDDRKQGKIES